MPDESPMTEEEARERMWFTVTRQLRRHDLAIGNIDACAESCIVDAVLATTAALAVLLDPETMLRAWERAGKVYWFTCGGIAWHLVHHDEEGAT